MVPVAIAVVVGCDFNPLINCERTSTMDAVCSVAALSLSRSMNEPNMVGGFWPCYGLFWHWERVHSTNERTNTRFWLFQVTLVLLYLIWNPLSSGIVEVAFFKTRLEFYCKLPSIYSTLPPIIGGVINTRTTSIRLQFCCSMLLLASCLWCCSEHCTELFRLCVLLIPVNATVGTGPDAIVLKW